MVYRLLIVHIVVVSLLALLAILALPSAAQAQCAGSGSFIPLECFEGSAKLTDTYTNTEELGPFLNKLFVGAIVIGAILAVLRIAWAGFIYLGDDLWSSKQQAKDIIQDSLLGLFLLLAIWLILNQINPQILELNVNLSKSAGSGSSGTGSAFIDSDTERASKG
ncbi:hypothetical protein HY478_03975, partial [Candidatus Uhrbacteria bacterium]|nr:hypothetical protein [Candidatus Uhrbacteria bacterium]